MSDLRVHIYYDDYYKVLDLRNEIRNSIKVGSDVSNDVVLYSSTVDRCAFILSREQEKWYLEDPNRTSIIFNGRNIEKRAVVVDEMYQVVSLEAKGKKMFVFIESSDRYKQLSQSFEISTKEAVSIGSAECDIHYKLSKMDDTAITIKQRDEVYFITDVISKKYKNSEGSKCVYVNDRRIRGEYQLNHGDTIAIDGYKIGFFVKVDSKLVDGYDITHKYTYIVVDNCENSAVSVDIPIFELEMEDQGDDDLFEIQSRLFTPMPTEKINIVAPPNIPNKPKINWLSILLPPVLMLTVFMVVMPMIRQNSGSGYGMMMVAFSCITVITSVVNYVTQKSKFKKDNKKRIEEYEGLLDKKRSDLSTKKEQEIASLFTNHLTYEQCLSVVEGRDRRLWERSFLHEDFLDIKIGLGGRSSSLDIKAPEVKESDFEPDPLLIKANELKDDFTWLDQAPITVKLKENPVVSVIGDRMNTLQLLRTMITQITTNHSYKEVKLVVLYQEEERAYFEWMRFLPHVWDSSKQFRYMASKAEDAKLILSSISEIIKERSEGEKENAMQVATLPHYVFLVCNRELLQNNPLVSQLIMPKEELGISSIFAIKDSQWVPQHCHYEIKMDHFKGEMITSGIRNDIQLFETEKTTISHMDGFSRSMAPIKIKNLATSVGIPSKVSLFDILEIKDVTELDVISKWKTNKAYKTMTTPVGKKLGDELFYFNIHEKEHGPHGLVAGTTGSGKSETMLSYLVSLCANYHPHQVGFVVIDYKGGGMINDIEALPHLLGSITNLDENQINRALLSLKSELKKRQRYFDRYKVNHIDAYMELHEEGIAGEALPHLILIVDEFAELKADQPEFMKELISAARIGRSLGIHLILATQKPSGVVNDQIWSNSRFKICLKVSTPQDSKEVLKKSDAAYITLPGRAYIQIGNDEIYELYQSAYGGVPYTTDLFDKVEEPTVFALDVLGRKKQIHPRFSGVLEEKSKVTQMQVVVKQINDSFDEMGIERLEGPWQPPLENRYSLKTYLGEMNRDNLLDYRVYLGVYDMPENQAQGLLYIDLNITGSTIIYGNPAMGKTNIMQTMIMYLVEKYTPDEIQIYIADFGSRIMGVFEEAPHVGGVVYAEELDRFERIIAYVTETINKRKKLFTGAGVTNIKAYNRIGEDLLAGMVIFIDNVAFLKEIQSKDYNEVLSILIRTGMNYGVYFILSSSALTGIGYKMVSAIPNAIALSLKEKSDYSQAMGKTSPILPKAVPGRGIAKKDGSITEFQGFLPGDGNEEYEITADIRRTLKEIKAEKDGSCVYTIPSLPEQISLKKFIDENQAAENLPLGLELEELSKVHVSLEDFGGFIVSGSRKTGLTSGLSMMTTLVNQMDKSSLDLFVIDNYESDLKNQSAEAIYANDKFTVADMAEPLTASYGDADKRTVLIISDLAYFMKISEESFRNKIGEMIGNGIYSKTNVIIGMKDMSVSGFDAFSKAIKGIDSGIALGHGENVLAAIGIKIPFEKRKEKLKPGQGYLQTVKDTWKIQLCFDDMRGDTDA